MSGNSEKAKYTTLRNTVQLFMGRKKLIVIILGVLAILLMVLIGMSHTPQKDNKVKRGPELTAEQRVLELTDRGDYKGAENVWEEKLKNTYDKEGKLSIYYKQAGIARKFKKYNDAEQYAEKAMALDPNAVTAYVALAHIYEARGSTEKAKESWNNAITKLDPNMPGYNLILRDYQNHLDNLK